jgi:hypothetical protein
VAFHAHQWRVHHKSLFDVLLLVVIISVRLIV